MLIEFVEFKESKWLCRCNCNIMNASDEYPLWLSIDNKFGNSFPNPAKYKKVRQYKFTRAEYEAAINMDRFKCPCCNGFQFRIIANPFTIEENRII